MEDILFDDVMDDDIAPEEQFNAPVSFQGAVIELDGIEQRRDMLKSQIQLLQEELEHVNNLELSIHNNIEMQMKAYGVEKAKVEVNGKVREVGFRKAPDSVKVKDTKKAIEFFKKIPKVGELIVRTKVTESIDKSFYKEWRKEGNVCPFIEDVKGEKKFYIKEIK